MYSLGYFKPTNIYTAQRPMLLMCGLTGIIPFNLTGGKGKEHFEVTYFGIIIALFHMAIFVICFIVTFRRSENFVSYFFKTDISQVTSLVSLSISFVAMAVIYPSCFIKKLKLINIFNLLAKVDRQFNSIHMEPPEYRPTMLHALKCLLGNCTLYGVFIVGSYLLQNGLERQANLNSLIVYFLPHLVLSFVVVKFMSIMWQIRRRFFCLNKVSKKKKMTATSNE